LKSECYYIPATRLQEFKAASQGASNLKNKKVYKHKLSSAKASSFCSEEKNMDVVKYFRNGLKNPKVQKSLAGTMWGTILIEGMLSGLWLLAVLAVFAIIRIDGTNR
jgi:hypothetical protein